MSGTSASGRKIKPTAIKALQGTLERSRINKLEPKPEVQLTGIPETLNGTDAGSWQDVGEKLKEMRVITGMDQVAFELLCGVYAEYIAARRVLWVEDASKPGSYTYTPTQEVITKGSGKHMKARPEVAIVSDTWRRLEKMLSNFGLTPSSRAKVQMVGDGNEKNNPFDKF